MENESELLEALSKDRAVRQAVTRESHPLFFSVYFPMYIKYAMAEFHKDILRITEDLSNKLACIVAFRGSGKSTLVTLSYSLWSILGIQQKKFVLIISHTQNQARHIMSNIRYELENNQLLKSDLGPFREDQGGEWAMSSIVFNNTGARIMVASFDQSIRGIRHREHRPDLIILDDIEDLNSTKTSEGRNKVFDWFTREILPLGDIGTRVIIVGNLLHEDSLVMRLKKKIDAKELDGIYKWFPLLNDEGKCLWSGKFNTQEKIDGLRRSVANEIAWQQEYLLKIIYDHAKLIQPGWIKTYSKLPDNFRDNLIDILIGVDLAISKQNNADYTSIVVIAVCHVKDQLVFYVLANPINKRMNYPEAIEAIKTVARAHNYGLIPKVVIESNGFQEIYANTLSDMGVDIIPVKNTNDKRSRLAATSYYIQTGAILFAQKGNESLLAQLTDFGVEGHDDLADAFAMAIIHGIEEHSSSPNIHIISTPISRPPWYFPGDESDPIDHDLC